MVHIFESMQRLYELIPTLGWAIIIAVFVFFAVLDRLEYFFALAGLVILAWLLRDFTIKLQFDPSYQYAFTGVVVATVAYAIYMVFHGLKRSGW